MRGSAVTVQAPSRWKREAATVHDVAESALRLVFGDGTALGMALVEEDAMARMNALYRGKRGATDVLSFPGEERGHAGEVALCLPVARRQARGLGHAVDVELAVLTVHALVHLAGMDHERSSDEARLQAEMEMGILDALGVPVDAALTRRGFGA